MATVCRVLEGGASCFQRSPCREAQCAYEGQLIALCEKTSGVCPVTSMRSVSVVVIRLVVQRTEH